MAQAQLEQKIKAFPINTTSDQIQNISDLFGQTVILYFYPKDNTPGCSMESKDFRDLYPEFIKQDCLILGVSRDSLSSHHKFIDKKQLPFPLISDTDEQLCNYFDVIAIKNLFGKKVRGIVRSTFLIDKNGVLRQEWRKVKVKGHAAEVLKSVKALNA